MMTCKFKRLHRDIACRQASLAQRDLHYQLKTRGTIVGTATCLKNAKTGLFFGQALLK